MATSGANALKVTKIYDGAFSDASVRNHCVFALQCTTGKIYLLHEDKAATAFKKQGEFKIQKHQRHTLNTIQVTSEYVYVGFPDKHMIHQYTFDGQLVQEHGTKGSGVGGLNRPLLTGCDSFNNILIAGNENHRLDVLRADGSFCRSCRRM